MEVFSHFNILTFLSHGSEQTIQNGMVNKNYDIETNSDFIIDLLKESISLLEWQLIEKKSITDFLIKHQMSPIATFFKLNCDYKVLNHESTEAIKN